MHDGNDTGDGGAAPSFTFSGAVRTDRPRRKKPPSVIVPPIN